MNKTWFTNFFGGVVVETWRHAATPEQTRVEADFLERELHLRPGQRVLDVPCGFGRHSLDLARRGYRMLGVDVSTEMMQAAGLHWVYTVGEIRSLLQEAGFADRSLYASHDGRPFELGSQILIVVAQKQ